MTPQTETHAAIAVAGITYPLAAPPTSTQPDPSPAATASSGGGAAFSPTEEEENLLVECGRIWIRRHLPADRNWPTSGKGPSFVRVDATALLRRAASAAALN